MRDSPLSESVSTFTAVVLAHAKTGVRSGWAYGPRDAHSKAPLRPPLPPNPESTPHDSSHSIHPTSTKAIWRPFKSHSQITASVANTSDLLQTALVQIAITAECRR